MKFVVILIAAALATPVIAADGGVPAITRALAATAGHELAFVQRFTPKGFTRDRVERGTVVFGTAPQMRWSYTAPEKKTFVFDGATSWFYLPEDRQVTIGKVTPDQKRALPFLMLADRTALAREFSVTESGPARARKIRLAPKAANSTIRALEVTLDASALIRRIEYHDRQGNRTVFEFSNARKVKSAPGTFRFVPPAGVEVIQTHG